MRKRIGSALMMLSMLIGCSQEPAEPPRRPDAVAVSNIVIAITSVFASDGDFRRLDVRDMKIADFHRQLEAVSPQATLWMPGEYDWLVLGTKSATAKSLGAAMETFAALDTSMVFADMFCAYVGTVAETLPAFSALDPQAFVTPQNFVTKDIPKLSWLEVADVDEDIRKGVLAEIRSLQNVRREVIKGNMMAATAKDLRSERAAIEVWAKAALRNPRDTFLAERLEHLDRNARGFLSLGKVVQAMKCFETMARIHPTAASVHNFGMCLKKIGRTDIAEKVLAHARELEKSAAVAK